MTEFDSYVQHIISTCNSALKRIEKDNLLKCSVQGYLSHLPFLKDVEDTPELKEAVESCVKKLLEYSINKGYIEKDVSYIDFQHYKW